MLFPVYFEGDITADEVTSLFRSAGYWLVTDGAGRIVARRVPQFLAKEPTSNVVRLPGRARKVAR